MRSGRLLSGLVQLVLAGTAGCGVDPGDTSSGGGNGGAAGGGGSGGSGVECPADPAEGPIPPECGIWVSASLGDDGNPGTQAAPVASLAHAIGIAEKGPRHVYACAETWTEPLVVPETVSMHGGFTCAGGWSYVGRSMPAKLMPPTTMAMKWLDVDEGYTALLTDFHVEAADAVEPGTASIGVFVSSGVRVTILRSEIVAGDGADGLDGIPGEAMPAQAGAPGNGGADACSAAETKGGAAPVTSCASGTSTGGPGGDGGLVVAPDGGNGQPAGPGGAGGLGEQSAPSCSAGQPGAPGVPAPFGLGAHGVAFLTADGYLTRNGEDGKPGAPGQGGGGGGGTFGSTAVCGAAKPGGAAGGSGGAGGCGGKGGGGGQGGGASIAIATLSSGLKIDQGTVLHTGNGGNGGNGGPPQPGGAGGLGGNGGAGMGTLQTGCKGGAGGAGGPGGWGGGGIGAHAVGVAHKKGIVFAIGTIDWVLGEKGEGGLGAPGAGVEASGQDGQALLLHHMDPVD